MSIDGHGPTLLFRHGIERYLCEAGVLAVVAHIGRVDIYSSLKLDVISGDAESLQVGSLLGNITQNDMIAVGSFPNQFGTVDTHLAGIQVIGQLGFYASEMDVDDIGLGFRIVGSHSGYLILVIALGQSFIVVTETADRLLVHLHSIPIDVVALHGVCSCHGLPTYSHHIDPVECLSLHLNRRSIGEVLVEFDNHRPHISLIVIIDESDGFTIGRNALCAEDNGHRVIFEIGEMTVAEVYSLLLQIGDGQMGGSVVMNKGVGIIGFCTYKDAVITHVEKVESALRIDRWHIDKLPALAVVKTAQPVVVFLAFIPTSPEEQFLAIRREISARTPWRLHIREKRLGAIVSPAVCGTIVFKTPTCHRFAVGCDSV